MESLRGLSSSPASAYDELVTGQKSIRYHWQGILSVIRALPGGLGERVESAQRQLEESGATVNLLDDRAAPRWTFDPLPFVVAPDEWAALETGLIQRASASHASIRPVARLIFGWKYARNSLRSNAPRISRSKRASSRKTSSMPAWPCCSPRWTTPTCRTWTW